MLTYWFKKERRHLHTIKILRMQSRDHVSVRKTQIILQWITKLISVLPFMQ